MFGNEQSGGGGGAENEFAWGTQIKCGAVDGEGGPALYGSVCLGTDLVDPVGLGAVRSV